MRRSETSRKPPFGRNIEGCQVNPLLLSRSFSRKRPRSSFTASQSTRGYPRNIRKHPKNPPKISKLFRILVGHYSDTFGYRDTQKIPTPYPNRYRKVSSSF